jgi:hypothetical protein
MDLGISVDWFAYRYEMSQGEPGRTCEHPQAEILRLAPDACDFEPSAIGECWFFSAPKIAAPPVYVVELHAGRYETSQKRWEREHPKRWC